MLGNSSRSAICDLLVIGWGAAALRPQLLPIDTNARSFGRKPGGFGGATAFSGGTLWAPENSVSQRAGIDDSHDAVTDRKNALQAMRRCKRESGKDSKCAARRGCVSQPFERDIGHIGGCHHSAVAKRNELHKFAVIPERGVCERRFAWLEKNRRLQNNCERHFNTNLVQPSSISSSIAQEIVNTLSGITSYLLLCVAWPAAPQRPSSHHRPQA